MTIYTQNDYKYNTGVESTRKCSNLHQLLFHNVKMVDYNWNPFRYWSQHFGADI